MPRILHIMMVLGMVSLPVYSTENLVTISSDYSVKESAERFEKVLNKKGLKIFAKVSHSDNAKSVGLELKPTELIIFGNPKVGTPVMQCSSTIAIDLPQKMLFWKNDKGQTQVSYNHPNYLWKRHKIEGCKDYIKKIASALDGLAKAAITSPSKAHQSK